MVRVLRGERIGAGGVLAVGCTAAIFDAAGRLLLTRRTWMREDPITIVRCLHPGMRYRLGSRFRTDGNAQTS